MDFCHHRTKIQQFKVWLGACKMWLEEPGLLHMLGKSLKVTSNQSSRIRNQDSIFSGTTKLKKYLILVEQKKGNELKPAGKEKRCLKNTNQEKTSLKQGDAWRKLRAIAVPRRGMRTLLALGKAGTAQGSTSDRAQTPQI